MWAQLSTERTLVKCLQCVVGQLVDGLPIQGSNCSSRTRDIGVTAIPSRTLGERCFGKETHDKLWLLRDRFGLRLMFGFPIRGLFALIIQLVLFMTCTQWLVLYLRSSKRGKCQQTVADLNLVMLLWYVCKIPEIGLTVATVQWPTKDQFGSSNHSCHRRNLKIAPFTVFSDGL